MITLAQARALIESAEYRDWKIENPDPNTLSFVDLWRAATAESRGVVPVVITYEAPNSDPGMEHTTVSNAIPVALELTETEAEFARELYEAISRIEDHERREFFKIGNGRIDGRNVEKGSRAIFHPHGVNRNRMFRDLDRFADGYAVRDWSGMELTGDAA